MLMASFGLQSPAMIESFQRALVNLATATGRPAINPGKVTGVVDDATMVAFSAALGPLAEELPTWLYLLVQGGLAAGVTSSKAKSLVTQYAAPLTVALNTAAVKFKQPEMQVATVVEPTPGPIASIFAPGWYTRPSLGLLIVGLGLFVGYKLLFAPSAKPAA